jgi:hypothetical protein
MEATQLRIAQDPGVHRQPNLLGPMPAARLPYYVLYKCYHIEFLTESLRALRRESGPSLREPGKQ